MTSQVASRVSGPMAGSGRGSWPMAERDRATCHVTTRHLTAGRSAAPRAPVRLWPLVAAGGRCALARVDARTVDWAVTEYGRCPVGVQANEVAGQETTGRSAARSLDSGLAVWSVVGWRPC